MYSKLYGIKEEAFSSSPDPKFLYKSEMHQEALDRLVRSVQTRKGINAIIGEPGLGKSTLIRTLLAGLSQKVHYAWIFNTTLEARDFLKYICLDFGLAPKGKDTSELLMEFYEFLIAQYEQGIYTLLIVDEAQNLKIDVLEEIRQLSNLETSSKKLLQVILSGQPRLNSYLDHDQLHQLKQRITLKASLTRFALKDTTRYIQCRLGIAGAKREDIFTAGAFDAIQEVSDGVPRLINQVCDNAIAEGHKRNAKQIDSAIIRELADHSKITLAQKASSDARGELIVETDAKETVPSKTSLDSIQDDDNNPVSEFGVLELDSLI
ncbi:AAA family ATPase [candidate division KSB1 bacterium]|nr:AAA family ATPase [candidate division KSB1 bacterium]